MPHRRHRTAADKGAKVPATAGAYRHLPDPVRLEDTIASQESGEVPDPSAGRDPERDFLLRYAG